MANAQKLLLAVIAIADRNCQAEARMSMPALPASSRPAAISALPKRGWTASTPVRSGRTKSAP
jgi:hypothetical protein